MEDCFLSSLETCRAHFCARGSGPLARSGVSHAAVPWPASAGATALRFHCRPFGRRERSLVPPGHVPRGAVSRCDLVARRCHSGHPLGRVGAQRRRRTKQARDLAAVVAGQGNCAWCRSKCACQKPSGSEWPQAAPCPGRAQLSREIFDSAGSPWTHPAALRRGSSRAQACPRLPLRRRRRPRCSDRLRRSRRRLCGDKCSSACG